MEIKRKIAVSIVVYQKYDEALQAVKSIEKHTGPDLAKTLYLIDNSSLPEENRKRANFEKAVSVYDDVIYMNTGSNLGFGKGHNYTIDRITEEYFAIVNPDILITDGTLEALTDMMDQDRSIGMTVPKLLSARDGDIQDAYRRLPTVFDMFIRMFLKKGFRKRRNYHSMQDMDFSKPFDVPFAHGSFLVIRTGLWKKLHGFDERYFMYMEDADLCRRVNEISRLVYCPDAVAIHRWEMGSHKNAAMFIAHIRSMIQYFNKWGWKLI